MKHAKILSVAALALGATFAHAATLRFHINGLNHGNGDRFQYRFPGTNVWTTAYPAYRDHVIHNAPNNIIVSSRVFNVYQNRIVSTSVKSTWSYRQGGDQNFWGDVHFDLNGTG